MMIIHLILIYIMALSAEINKVISNAQAKVLSSNVFLPTNKLKTQFDIDPKQQKRKKID